MTWTLRWWRCAGAPPGVRICGCASPTTPDPLSALGRRGPSPGISSSGIRRRRMGRLPGRGRRPAGDQLDPVFAAWRLHVFPQVSGVPGTDTAIVAVLQIAHALPTAPHRRTGRVAVRRDVPVPRIATGPAR